MKALDADKYDFISSSVNYILGNLCFIAVYKVLESFRIIKVIVILGICIVT